MTTSTRPEARPETDGNADLTARSNNFDQGWRFFRGTPNGAERPGYDDSDWREVTLPHDYGVEGRFSRNARATVGYLKVGEGWYRKTFTAPESLAGKYVTLDFDGAMDRAEVWLNGEKVAEHHYGYTSFAVDLTGRIKPGESNVLTVRTVNEEPSSRWYAGAGLYRDVTLTVADPVHVARFGTQITTPSLEQDVKDGRATVLVSTIVANGTASDAAIELRQEILDANGVVVAAGEDGVTVPAGTPDTTEAAAAYDAAEATNRFETTLSVTEPHLWSTADPYQYTLRTTVLVDGKAVDATETRFGLRWITLDPARGLFLNGVNMRALGMCMHHDLGALGAATYRRAVVRQLEILKDAGVNAIRTSHNPCSKVWAEECSRMGFLLLEELTDMWTAPKNRNDYSNYFAQDYPEDLAAMILRDRNEPAVFMWGMGNEVAWQESEIPIAADLTRRCHLLDPTRPNSVNDASYLSKGIDGIGNKIHEQMDVRGYSYINRDQMEKVHEKHPNDVILNSESGNCTPCRGFYVHPTILTDEWQLRGRDYPFAKGRQPWREDTYEISDYNVTTNRGYPLDIAFGRLVNLPFNVGEFAWTGFDYIGEPAPYISNFYWNKPDMPESDGTVLAPLRSYYGMVDTAGFPKNPWWLYKALWTDPDDAPMVHLLPHWNWDEGESVAVWAYTNAASAELFLNGRSLGRREFESHQATFHLNNKYADKPFEYRYQKDGNEPKQLTLQWEVPFEPGTVEVVAYDKAGNEVAHDAITTAGAPAGIRLIPDRHVIDDNGHDLSFIEADVIDDAGVIVPRANDELTFHVEHGRLLGTDNGYQANTEPLQSPVHSAYSGKVLAIVASDGSGKPIRVTATAKGLRSDTVNVFVTESTADKAHNAGLPLSPAAQASSPDKGSQDQTFPVPVARRSSFPDKGNQGNGVLEVRDVAVRVRAGETPALPRTVTALLADNTRAEVPVEWTTTDLLDAVAAAEAKSGAQSFTVTGKAAGLPVSATVTVTHPVAARPVSLASAAGTVPALPAHAMVIFDDGSSVDAPVDWTTGGEAASWTPGTVTVDGTVEGYGLPVTASVRVVDPAGVEGAESLAHDTTELASVTVDGQAVAFDSANRTVLHRAVTVGADETARLTVNATDETGAAIDLGGGSEAVVTFSSSHESVAGVDGSGVVTGRLSGTASVSATVTYGGVAKTSAPAIVTVTEGAAPKRATGAVVPAVRTVAGTVPELPTSASASFDHGVDAPLPVEWDAVPAEAYAQAGEVSVQGHIARLDLDVSVTVHVVKVLAVQTVSLATITGIEPQVGETAPEVTVYWSDGAKEQRAVTWDRPAASLYRSAGTFTLLGTVDGLEEKAIAHVRVTDDYVQNRDLFSYRNDVYPQVRASYTNPDPKAQEDASLLMDGIVSYTPRVGYNLKNRWSTFGDPSRTAWLEYRFGYGEETPFMLNSFTVYYCLDGEGVALPESVGVEYLEADGSWQPVRGLSAASHPVEQTNDAAWVYATVGDKPGSSMSSRGDEITYSFDMVRTSRIRITFMSAKGSNVAITEVRGDARIPAQHGEAVIAGLLANGKEVAGFDPAVEHYTVAVPAGETPEIQALPGDGNAAVTVVNAAAASDEAQVIVTSEDGITTHAYHVAIVPEQ
ncbi:Ig-like domain-containing protein [Bifidobacterium callitrichidarum]|nr:Ig-like domain-containing protein [Bifidobacterium callitrichidarum]